MLGCGNLSRCCRHVQLTSTTSTWTGRRVLSTVSLSSRISASNSRQSTQLPPSTIYVSSFTQWLASLRSKPKVTTVSISTSNKKPPAGKPSPAQQTSPAAAGGTKADDGKAPITGPKFIYPERLIIYHAGTGKIIFLATLKLTTIFAFALFDLWALPAFVDGAASIYQSVGIALCGIIPLTFVAYTTTPYVTTIHLHLPQFARISAQSLERFAKGVPPTTKLDISTLSFIAKPRTSSLTVGDLKPLVGGGGDASSNSNGGWIERRLGMVNYTRDVAELNKQRKWWRFRAVGQFGIQIGREVLEKKLPRSGWVWGVVEDVIRRRNGLGVVAEKGKVQAVKGKK